MAGTLKQYLGHFWRTWVIFLAPAFLCWILWIDLENQRAMKCLYILVIMAVYWMTTALPLPITSLIPIVAFPLSGIMSTSAVCATYFNSTMFMFIGGLVMALGIEESGLHKRAALKILMLKFLRTRNWGIMLGFMSVTAFLSMWVSNTATVAMMIPIVDAVCESLYRDGMDHRTRNMLLLSVAYSANIGGTGVITGSPPNLIVLPQLKDSPVTYGSWMAFCIPLMLFNLIVAFLWLQLMNYLISKFNLFEPDPERVRLYDEMVQKRAKIEEIVHEIDGDKTVDEEKLEDSLNTSHMSSASEDTLETSLEMGKVDADPAAKANKESPTGAAQKGHDKIFEVLMEEREKLGSFNIQEALMLASFCTLIVLWFLLDPKFIDGWGKYFTSTLEDGTKITMSGATPAMAMILVIFVLPKKGQFWPFLKKGREPRSSEGLLTWYKIEKNLPWGVLLLLGGGFALSQGCTTSGLSDWIADLLKAISGLSPWVLNLIVSVVAATITEFVSNTATANILVPILRQLALSLCQNPIYLVMTTVISCSYAFMLPVATAPNALVYDASTFKTSFMSSVGFFMNVICVVNTNVAINLYGEAVFGSFDGIPVWAEKFGSQEVISNCSRIL